MTQQEKQLLLRDLSARVPYGVIVHRYSDNCYSDNCDISIDNVDDFVYFLEYSEGEEFKPYLRPMSSITEKEKKELLNLLFDKEAKYFYIDEEGTIDGKTFDLMKDGLNYPTFCPVNIVLYTDWLNEHHFDYRGLIPMGLALEAPEGMYKIQ